MLWAAHRGAGAETWAGADPSDHTTFASRPRGLERLASPSRRITLATQSPLMAPPLHLSPTRLAPSLDRLAPSLRSPLNDVFHESEAHLVLPAGRRRIAMLKPTGVRSSSVELLKNDGSAKRQMWPRISLFGNALLALTLVAMARKAQVLPPPRTSLPAIVNLHWMPPPPPPS